MLLFSLHPLFCIQPRLRFLSLITIIIRVEIVVKRIAPFLAFSLTFFLAFLLILLPTIRVYIHRLHCTILFISFKSSFFFQFERFHRINGLIYKTIDIFVNCIDVIESGIYIVKNWFNNSISKKRLFSICFDYCRK